MPVVQKRTALALVHSRATADYAVVDPAERRAYERLTVSSLSWLKRVRLKYGPPVTLIDLSAGGAQIETTSRHIQPGRRVVVELEGRSNELAVASQVLRCHVSGIVPETIYRGALEFKQPLDFPPDDSGRSAHESYSNPGHQYAKLLVALRRAMGSGGASDDVAGVGAASLAAAHAIIDSPSSRRAGAPFSRELGRLFGAVASWVDKEESVDAAVEELTERLRRVIPVRTIRVMTAASMLTLASSDAIAFDVPSSAGLPAKLVVEFPRNCRLGDWHLQLLKVAAHLVALITEIEEARRAARDLALRERAEQQQRDALEQALREQAAHERAARANAARKPVVRDTIAVKQVAARSLDHLARDHSAVHGPTWHRLVVRYTDGRMLKGYGRDFVPANGQVHVWPVPDGPPETRITVLLSHLKAVFFVREFDGAPVDASHPSVPRSSGRRIAVTFLDGEVLNGRTLNYSADGPGFFVCPSDGATNNHRIFVVSSAVRHIQFP